MPTRQSQSIQRLRVRRRIFGECRDCGQRADGYRCEKCNERRRDAARLLMQTRRAQGLA